MDIAKIRKKAREREKKAEERENAAQQPEPCIEEGGAEKVPEIDLEPPPDADTEGDQAEAVPGLPEEKPTEDRPEEKRAEENRPEEDRPEENRNGQEDADDKMIEILTFALAKEEFAFRVPEVEEIVRYLRTTKVPSMPGYVRGITSLRGKIIPVIELKTKLGLKDSDEKGQERSDPDPDSLTGSQEKILILAGPKGPIGALIDKVIGVVRLPQSKVLEPPAHLNEDEVKFIEGVVIYGKRFISIIRSEDALNIEAG